MKNLQKKPLTHKRCVKSNFTVLKLIGAFSLIFCMVIPFGIAFSSAPLDDSSLSGVIFGAIFGLACAGLGVWILVDTLKKRAKLLAKQYYIYIDVVSNKRIQRANNGVVFLVEFANNKHAQGVSRKVFERTQIGTQYYMLQLNDAKKALQAFPEDEYYLGEDVRSHFRCY